MIVAETWLIFFKSCIWHVGTICPCTDGLLSFPALLQTLSLVVYLLSLQGGHGGLWERDGGHGLPAGRRGGQLWDGGVAGLHHHRAVLWIPLPGVHADGQGHLPCQVTIKAPNEIFSLLNRSLRHSAFCLFQWLCVHVRERVFREEHHVPQEQEAAPPRLGVPSPSGELQHVQKGVRL